MDKKETFERIELVTRETGEALRTIRSEALASIGALLAGERHE